MQMSAVTSKGQVTIPKEIRDMLGLKEHDRVQFVKRGPDVLLKPVKGNILDLRGSIKPRNRPGNFEEIRKITRKKMAFKVVKK